MTYELIQLIGVAGIMLKLTLAIIGSFRGWKGWPWVLWLGVEFCAGIALGIVAGNELIGPEAAGLAIIFTGAITLCALLYMACRRRYPVIDVSKDFAQNGLQ
jgi:hypothetical protein